MPWPVKKNSVLAQAIIKAFQAQHAARNVQRSQSLTICDLPVEVLKEISRYGISTTRCYVRRCFKPTKTTVKKMLGKVYDIQESTMSDFGHFAPQQARRTQASHCAQRSKCILNTALSMTCKLFADITRDILYEENKFIYLQSNDVELFEAMAVFGIKLWRGLDDARVCTDIWTTTHSGNEEAEAAKQFRTIRPIMTMTMTVASSDELRSSLFCLEDLPQAVGFLHVRRHLRNPYTLNISGGAKLCLLLEHGLHVPDFCSKTDGLEKLLLLPVLPWIGTDCILDGLWSCTSLSEQLYSKALHALAIYQTTDATAELETRKCMVACIVVTFEDACRALAIRNYKCAEQKLVLIQEQLGNYFRCRVINYSTRYSMQHIDLLMEKHELEHRVYLASTYYLSLLRSDGRQTSIGNKRTRVTTAILSAKASERFQRFCSTSTEHVCRTHYAIIKNCLAMDCWGLASVHAGILNKVLCEKASMILYNPNKYAYHSGYKDLKPMEEAYNKWWATTDASAFQVFMTGYLLDASCLIEERWGSWNRLQAWGTV